MRKMKIQIRFVRIVLKISTLQKWLKATYVGSIVIILQVGLWRQIVLPIRIHSTFDSDYNRVN